MTPASPRLVVVGASLAGLRAAEAARDAGHDGAIVLLGAEAHLPYDRPPLSKAFLGAAEPTPVVQFRDEHHLRETLGVDLRLGTPATGLDAAARQVVVAGGRVGYDALVIATGARARAVPGSEGLAGVHTLRTVDDAVAVRAALDAGARTVVVGGGFIGSEVASAARDRGLPVTVVEALPTPLARAVGAEMGTALSALHAVNGTELRCGLAVAGFEGTSRVTGVRLADGTVLPADLVVVGVGAIAETDWLAGSGVVLSDGVVADETLATSVPGVYAAGDVVRWHNPLFDAPMRVEHWTNAAEQGARAGLNALAPERATVYESVPYFWSDWYDSRIQFVGVPGADEVRVVSGDVADQAFVALYRRGDRLVGALAVNRRADVMKYRGQIGRRASWDDALALAARLDGRARRSGGRAAGPPGRPDSRRLIKQKF